MGNTKGDLFSHSPSSQRFFLKISPTPLKIILQTKIRKKCCRFNPAGFDSSGSKFNHHPGVELPFIRSDVCQKVPLVSSMGVVFFLLVAVISQKKTVCLFVCLGEVCIPDTFKAQLIH